MALGIGRAAGITVGVCALIAVVWLPPKPPSAGDRQGTREVEAPDVSRQLKQDVARTSRELSLAVEGLRFLQRRDSLARALAGTDGTLFGTAAPDWLAEQTAQVRATVSAGDIGVRVLSAVFTDTVSWRHRSPEQRGWEGWSNSTVTAFDSAAAPFSCVTIHDLRRMTGLGGSPRLMAPNQFRAQIAFGICRFFAAYGAPGPAVDSWLRDGAWRFGANEDIGYPHVFQEPFFLRQSTFTVSSGGRQVALGSCIEGSTSGCRTWLRTPDDRRYPRLDHMSAYVAGWWRMWYGDGLLDGLEQEMGPERMRAFWTSSLPLDSAFVSAFGVDMGTWAYGWLDRQFGPLPRKGPGSRDYAVTVLLAGLLVAFGAAKAQARKVR